MIEIDVYKIIKELIAEYPNDTDLGKKVRDLVYGIKKIKQMGFNKRTISKKHILNNLDNIMNYLDADAVFTTDEFSLNVYRLFNQGKSEEEILEYINNNI